MRNNRGNRGGGGGKLPKSVFLGFPEDGSEDGNEDDLGPATRAKWFP